MPVVFADHLAASRHIRGEPEELVRLDGAIRGRPVMLVAWAACTGRRSFAAALARITHANRAAKSIAAQAREAFA